MVEKIIWNLFWNRLNNLYEPIKSAEKRSSVQVIFPSDMVGRKILKNKLLIFKNFKFYMTDMIFLNFF